MVKFSVCIEMFWKDMLYEKRVELVGKLGFKYIEFWNWQNKDLDKINVAIEKSNVKVAAFCMESSKPLVDPNAKVELIEGLKKTVAAAKKIGVDKLILTTGNERKDESFNVTRNTVVRNLKALVPVLEKTGITLCIEPLNTIVNHLGYWLTKMSDAADIVFEVNSPQVKILMDIYHQQITEGNIIHNIRQYLSLIGHFHTAGVPGRNELVGNELDYHTIFAEINKLGYNGYIGLEFLPTKPENESLKEIFELIRGN